MGSGHHHKQIKHFAGFEARLPLAVVWAGHAGQGVVPSWVTPVTQGFGVASNRNLAGRGLGEGVTEWRRASLQDRKERWITD